MFYAEIVERVHQKVSERNEKFIGFTILRVFFPPRLRTNFLPNILFRFPRVAAFLIAFRISVESAPALRLEHQKLGHDLSVA